MAGPLENCNIALSGTFPRWTHGVLGDNIKKAGGSYAAKVSTATTHLVTTVADWTKNSAKVKQARSLDIPAVNLEWLLTATEDDTLVDVAPFLFGSGSPQPAPGDSSKKRDRSGSSEADKQDQSSSNQLVDANASSAADPDSTGGPQKKQKTKPANGKDTQQDSAAAIKSAKKMRIPADESCHLSATHEVYISEGGVIYDASLNQTNAGANNNKFYRIALLHNGGDDYCVWTRWGRVGERGQSGKLGDRTLTTGIRDFEKKFREKSGLSWAARREPPKPGKYVFIERSYEPDSTDDEEEANSSKHEKSGNEESGREKKEPLQSTLTPAVQRLMQLIFNDMYFSAAMAEMNYDKNKLPLGKLSKRTLEQGYQALKDLAQLLAGSAPNSGSSSGHSIPSLSNLYYSLIPHDFGRRAPPVICNNDLLKKEVELLQSLGDMSIAEEIKSLGAKADGVHPLDRQYAGLNLSEMVPLGRKSTEFEHLANYLVKSHGETHTFTYKVQDIFRIERQGEGDRFQQSPFAKIQGDRRLLWHGSRSTNFGGILSQGLRIAPPEAPVSGYMFGKGVYLADMSSKSANYCCSWSSGGIGLLLLCEAELGNPLLELTNADYDAGERAKKAGCYSTWGKGMHAPVGWKDAACVHESLRGVLMPDTEKPPGPTGIDGACLFYNEYICYDVAQIRLRYLFKVKMD